MSEININKVVDAFVEARKSFMEEEERIRALGVSRGSQSYLELRQKEMDKFKAVIKEVPDDVLVSLSNFISINAWRWDQMAETVTGFELDKEKKKEAMKLLNAYVVEYENVYHESLAARDRSLANKAQLLKENLDLNLAKILTKEQYAKWKESSITRR